MGKLYTKNSLEAMADGDSSFVNLMLETFVTSCRDAVVDMREAMNSADLIKINQTAHKIKPSVDTVAPALSERVRKLESMSDVNEVSSVELFAADLCASLDQIEADLSQE
ncbi:MAG: Hpt domain-containing protein [Flavobacteriales bacterium]|jgi:HPt (histidine-containing phosphotransfer) domain-containing protein|nr:Hpt domain-containing protein [Flavobacteriales bacterium]